MTDGISQTGPFGGMEYYCRCQFCGRYSRFEKKEEVMVCNTCKEEFSKMEHPPKKPIYEKYCEEILKREEAD